MQVHNLGIGMIEGSEDFVGSAGNAKKSGKYPADIQSRCYERSSKPYPFNITWERTAPSKKPDCQRAKKNETRKIDPKLECMYYSGNTTS